MKLNILRKPVFYAVLVALLTVIGTVSAEPKIKFSTSIEGFVLSAGYSNVDGQPTGEGFFGNGQMGYPENSCIPALVIAENTESSKTGDINFEIIYDYHKKGSVTDAIGIDHLNVITTAQTGDLKNSVTNLNQFIFTGNDFSSAAQFGNSEGGSNAALIAGPFSGNNGSSAINVGDDERHYNVTLAGVGPGSKVYIPICLQMGPDASEFPGSSMHVGPGNGGGLQINSNDLIVLPNITISNTVASGTAAADLWSFHISPAINGVANFYIPTGSDNVVISNVDTNGIYSISEFGPEGYEFYSGNGVNCVFNGSTGTASIASGNLATNAVCNFVNGIIIATTTTGTISTSTLTVTSIVKNDNGGSAQVGDFSLFLDDVEIVASSTVEVSTGTHKVAVSVVSGYTVVFGGDCDYEGNVIVNEGENKICTITYDDQAPTVEVVSTGTVRVVSEVINDNGGTFSASDFSVSVTGVSASPTSFSGVSGEGQVVVLATGTYSITQTAVTGYNITYSADCSGIIEKDDAKVCTITADDETSGGGGGGGGKSDPSYIIVSVIVDNAGGGDATSSDFTITLSGNDLSTSTFLGSMEGITSTLSAGNYSVAGTDNPKYIKNFGENCSGIVGSGQVVNCNVQYTYVPLKITDSSGNAGTNYITLTWTTNHPATSRVIYDTGSHEFLGEGNNYGYVTSTLEIATFTVRHSVTIPDLSPGTTYFLRPVSHGSPEIAGSEVVITTMSNSGGGSGSFGGGSSSGPAAIVPVAAAPMAVLAEKIIEERAPEAVLGLKLLPETGGSDPVNLWSSLLGVFFLLAGAKIIRVEMLGR